jgi:hypothetical protein
VNMLPNILTGSAVAGSVEFRYLLYFYIISAVAKAEDDLVCAYTVDDVQETFERHGEDAVTEAIEELEKEKLIVVSDDWIFVGKIVNRKKVLFEPADGAIEVYYERLLERMDDYISGAVRVARARRAKMDAETLFEKPVTQWLVNDFTALYELAYEAVYEEQLRDITFKERGQFNYLLKQYDKTTLQKMVIHYVLNADTYVRGGAAPTIALLVYHKDTLKLAVEKKSKSASSRKAMRSTSKKDEDF